MKYWISKYALTDGIFEVEVEKDYPYCFLEFQYTSKHIHETEAAARSAAEEMKAKKLSSLRKQIEGLERMEF